MLSEDDDAKILEQLRLEEEAARKRREDFEARQAFKVKSAENETVGFCGEEVSVDTPSTADTSDPSEGHLEAQERSAQKNNIGPCTGEMSADMPAATAAETSHVSERPLDAQEQEPAPSDSRELAGDNAAASDIANAGAAEEVANGTSSEAADVEGHPEEAGAWLGTQRVPDGQPETAAVETKGADAAEVDFAVGGRVIVKGLEAKPQINGSTGTIIEKKWKGNWVVDLDDESGKKKRLRRRWLINATNLERTDKPEIKKYHADQGRPKQQYYIVGTWNDQVPRRMNWDHERLCWTFETKVGAHGFECFQIWLDRDKRKCVHPDTANAGTYVPWELCGPDSNGDNKNWSFGDGTENQRFEIRLSLWEDESPQGLEWSDMDVKPKDTEEENRKCIKGHLLKLFLPPVDGYTCSKCKRNFPKGFRFFSCRPCDYDVCENCHGSQTASSASNADPKSGTKNGVDVLEAARKFLTDCQQGETKEDTFPSESAEKMPAKMPAKTPVEHLKAGDRVSIYSEGPYKGKQGSVMKVDEDGDPAVRLDDGPAKLFYRADVKKVVPGQPTVAGNPTHLRTPLAKGSAKGMPKGAGRGLGVLGFKSSLAA